MLYQKNPLPLAKQGSETFKLSKKSNLKNKTDNDLNSKIYAKAL
jgi:hypothetical protein